MKKIGIVLVMLVASFSFAMGQQSQEKKAPKAVFEASEHDFGKVAESTGSISTVFKFKNAGDAPLIIQRAATTCGCTASDYTKEPILPGKEGMVKVTYSTTGRPGIIDRNITIFSNVPDSVYVLKIKGEVLRNK